MSVMRVECVISKYRRQAKGHYIGYLSRFIAVMIFYESQN